jgi:hypothetical protein
MYEAEALLFLCCTTICTVRVAARSHDENLSALTAWRIIATYVISTWKSWQGRKDYGALLQIARPASEADSEIGAVRLDAWQRNPPSTIDHGTHGCIGHQ